jgi:ABC-type nitrate/sulfonate/bicarbonate transport system substrate-binding protein
MLARGGEIVRRMLAALAALLLLLLTAAGCGDDDEGAPQSEGGRSQITVGIIPIADVAPAYLGIDKGFFREEGLDVELQPFEGGAAVIPAVAKGDVQFAFGNAVSLAFAQQRGIDFQYVTEGVQGGSSSKDSTNGLIVHEESDIRTPQDLAGKTFAVNTLNSLGEVTIKTALEKEGVDVSDLEFVEVPFPDMIPALERKQFDVAWATEPFISGALAAGHRKILDPMVATHPRLTLAAYFAATEFIEENPETVAKFKRAMNRSLDYAAAHEEETREAIKSNTEIPPEVVDKMPLPHWTSELNAESIRALLQQCEKYGYFDDEIDIEAIVGPNA